MIDKPFHATSEEFILKGFTLKNVKCFPPHHSGHVGFVHEQNSLREITCMIIVTPSFPKTFSVFKTFFVHMKTNS